ncbi:nitrogen regulation protein NR(II), partial [candidate division CSSED10-310 bacterium]
SWIMPICSYIAFPVPGKNPLASLKGATEIISDEIAADSPRRKMVTILKSELARLSSLLDRFLSFARPQEFTTIPLLINEIIVQVITLTESEANKTNVSITYEQKKDQLRVNADKEKIMQVFLNIILNAIQEMPEGGKLKISYSKMERRKQSYAQIIFEDTGSGIAEDIKEKIFNPFFSTKESGTGLGLAIAARIVDQHQGLIEAFNNSEQGACFRILLPTIPDTIATKQH